MRMTLLSLLCGTLCGALSAWGVGGGTLLLAVMTLFLGVEQRTAQGINLLFFLPAAAAGLLCHLRADRVDRTVLRKTLPCALAAALTGALLSLRLNTTLLRRPFGLLLLLCGSQMLRRSPGKAE